MKRRRRRPLTVKRIVLTYILTALAYEIGKEAMKALLSDTPSFSITFKHTVVNE